MLSKLSSALCGAAAFALLPSLAAQAATKPNIVVILADDLGYGDLSCYGATKIATPNIDSLCKTGVKFTDAHTAASVCSPSRYAILTGRYAWRTWAQSGTIWADDPLVIDQDRLTLPRMLKSDGYKTAIVGKWHLGFDSPTSPGWDDKLGPDWNGELKPGPLEVGFDYYFGIPHTGQQPNVLIENHRVVGLTPGTPMKIQLDPKWDKEKVSYLQRIGVPAHKFTGDESARYEHESLAITLTDRAVRYIDEQRADKPFFLYFAHRNPHTPIRPNARFKGTSAAGVYGDFVQELDWSVGEVLNALKKKGLDKNTIVIFTSDNGGVTQRVAQAPGHDINGVLRGAKAEVYEGGHRVPFIVKWPGVVPQGTTSGELISLADMMATFAAFEGNRLPDNAAEDSFSFLDVLKNPQRGKSGRTDLVMVSDPSDGKLGTMAFRQGSWKVINGLSGGGRLSAPVPENPNAPKGQLYNLSDDLAETNNLYASRPDIVARLNARLWEVETGGRSRPFASAAKAGADKPRRP